MLAEADSPPAMKRRRFAIADPMSAQFAREKLAAAKQNYGREILVFETATEKLSQVCTSNDAPDSEEPDELEFTTEDYYRILSAKKEDTVPPKKQIKDMSKDFYSTSFAPGAIVYFSYDLPQGDDITSGPFLKEDVMSLKGPELILEQKPEVYQPALEPVVASSPPPQKLAAEKMVKPRWLNM